MSARTEGFEALSLPDLERRTANMVRFGKVVEVDHAKRRVKVETGDLKTAWLSWGGGRAGAGKRRWDAPEVGEQGLLLAPTGDLRQAAFIPGFYQDAYDAPSSDPNVDKVEYGDGTVIQYDRGSSTLLADLGGSKVTATPAMVKLEVGGVSITLAGGGITIEGNVTLDGNISQAGSITSSGDHQAGGISLQQHRHISAPAGNPTSPPQ